MTNDPARGAVAKLARAKQHALDLEARILGWVTNVDLQPVGAIGDDRLSWEMHLPDFALPPLAEWALIFGDSVHNVRSALDVLVWAHVDESKLTQAEARRIAFPICAGPKAWADKAALLRKAVPAEVVDRIEVWQTFQRPPAKQHEDPLPLIAELDNRDKHRLAVSARLQVNKLDYHHVIEFMDDEAASRNTPPQVTVHEPSLTPGSLVMSGTTLDPIARISGRNRQAVQVGVDLAPPRGFAGVVDLIEVFVAYATELIAHVAGVPALDAQEGHRPDGDQHLAGER